MKNFSIVWTVVFLMIACNSTGTGSSAHDQLAALDSLVNNQPEQVTDRLEKMDIGNYSGQIGPIYYLLLTIARNNSYVEFRDDSIISSATDWYRLVKTRYYMPGPSSTWELCVMRSIQWTHYIYPFEGSRTCHESPCNRRSAASGASIWVPGRYFYAEFKLYRGRYLF